MDLYHLPDDPSEEKNLADAHPDKVVAMQQRLNSLAKESAKPLFLADQFKVIQRNMAGEPVLPTEEGFGDPDRP